MELRGSLTRGQSVFDYGAPKAKHNVEVIMDMDMGKVVDMLDQSVS